MLVFCIRELEDAIDMCKNNNTEGANHEVDEAIAFWTGSLEGTDGSGDGVMAYALADKRCANFKTCGDAGDSIEGTSAVNTKYFDILLTMTVHLTDKDCEGASVQRDSAISVMFVPVIQGTLLYAQRLSVGNTNITDKEEGEGAAFAAAV